MTIITGTSGDDNLKGTKFDDFMYGGDGEDLLLGRAGNDYLDGGAGNDALHGDAGDDTLVGGQGDDFLHGGIGTDTAVYSGSVLDYSFSTDGENFFVSHTGGTQIDGNDRLLHIERLQFSDIVIDLTQNNAPLAFNDVASTDEDVGTYSSGSASVLDNDFDWEGDTLTATPGTFNGTYGTLVLNADGTYTYTPYASTQALDDGETVQDNFTYTVSDGSLSDTGTLTINIAGLNDAPVANDDTASTTEDAAVSGNVLANDTDVDVEPLTVANPGTYVGAYGTLVLAADGSYTYTPNAAAQALDDGEVAQDVFTYTASDGTASDTATLTVTVNGLNDAPVANDDTASTTEDAAVSGNVLANDTDVDVEPLTVANPGTYVGAYGTLVLAADGSYTYTPNAAAQALDDGEQVYDAFTYTASDGTASDTATLTVTVNGLNDAPVANDDAASTTEDAAVSGNVLTNDTDVDGETLTAVPGTFVGTYGTLVLAADGSYTYTPNAAAQALDDGEVVSDVFTYTASDGTAADTATLTVTVNGLNDAPVANDDTASTTEDASVSGNVLTNDTDVDGETLTAVPGTFVGTYGTLVLAADGSYTYTPNAAAQALDDGEVVSDVFTYTASDGTAADTATLTVTVNGLNDAPVANDDTASTTEDASVSGNVLTNDTDVDGEALTAVPGTFVGTYGTLVLAADGSYTYTPNAAQQGLDDGEVVSDVFTYTASDGTVSDTATLTVTVNGLNDAPVANDDTASTTEDASVSGNVLTNDTDVDGETLTVANPGTYVGTYGTLVLAADGSYTYAPNAAQQGLDVGETVNDVFSYTASDGTASDPATLTVTVNGTNDAPVANDDTASTDEDTNVSGNVLTNDTDVDGETLTAVPGTFVGTYGTLVLAADGSYTYTPNAAAQALDAGDVVNDVFTYTASDGTTSDTATLTVTVTGADEGPQTVWYIDNSAVGSTNVGTQANPFLTIADFNAAQGNVGGPQDGATVYLLQGTGIYAEADGINLLDDQILIGVGQPTIAPLSGNGIDLADNNNVSGVDINVSAGNVGIEDDGSSVGNLTVSDVAIAGAGQIVDLDTGGTLNVTLNSAASTGSSGGAIDLAGVGGSFTVSGATTIAGSHVGGGIDVTGSSLTVALSGGGTVSTGADTAVNFAGNSGALAVSGGLDIVTTSGAGLNASGGGTVTVTGAGSSVTSTTGIAVTISGTAIGAGGVTLDSVSSNGAVSGIVLANTGGGAFSVTGTGVAGSGGAIASSTGAGISLTNTGPVSLTDIAVSSGGDDGIRGTGVNGLALIGATVANNGNAAGERGVDLIGLTGISTVTNSSFTGSGEDNFSIVNSAGTLDLTVTGSTFGDLVSPISATADDGLFIQATGTALVRASVTGSTFTNNRGDHFQFTTDTAASTSHITFNDNVLTSTFAGVVGGGILINPTGAADLFFAVEDNNIQGAFATAINANMSASTAAGAVHGTIAGNTIGTAGVANSGSASGNGVNVQFAGAGAMTVLVDDNDVHGWSSSGINSLASGSGRLNLTITDNVIDTPGGFALNSIRVVAGAAAVDTAQIYLELNGNNSNTALPDDIFVRTRFNADILMPGYVGATGDAVAADAFLTAENPLGGNVLIAANALAGSGFFDTPGSAAVPLPIYPDTPFM